MAENKQYITQKQENGSVLISEDVIAAIVSHTVSEVEGVVGLSAKPGSEIADFIGKKNWGKGLKVDIQDDDTVKIECDIIIAYGQSVVTVANNVQAAVTSAVESMTAIKVNEVNVNVCGIARQ